MSTGSTNLGGCIAPTQCCVNHHTVKIIKINQLQIIFDVFPGIGSGYNLQRSAITCMSLYSHSNLAVEVSQNPNVHEMAPTQFRRRSPLALTPPTPSRFASIPLSLPLREYGFPLP